VRRLAQVAERARLLYGRMPPAVRRIAVGVAGAATVAAGLALLVLPGPGLLVIALGLAILALEFAWARRLLLKVRARLQSVRRRE